MTRKIQAYFRTENEAEGAKTSLIAYKVDGLEVWPLTDPLDRDRNILFPIAPFSNTSVAAGTVGSLGAESTPAAGAMLVPGLAASQTRDDEDDHYRVDEDKISANVADGDLEDGDLDDLHYVMELNVAEDNYNEVVEILRGKRAYVEVFE